MPPPEVWGPPIWTFFHTLAYKLDNPKFQLLHGEAFSLIKQICTLLPCPDCSEHATAFLNKIKGNEINSPSKFVNLFYLFQKSVNARKKKALYNYSNLIRYKYIPIGVAFNNFVKIYNTKGNLNLINESFRRTILIQNIKKWLNENLGFLHYYHIQKPIKIIPKIVEDKKLEEQNISPELNSSN
jgi:hypothetical protein